ncbi:CMRF35-like molecule 1 isoform X2 [Meles meles]|uniref:CMRF35-like molecule 1 isoform X2 n=1 Tax=Meles meles TaxID=9662 RepID=UPI001E699EE9|nr:CMRF35-like molecule 1 isoform X2 [Meles meles]
MGSGRRRKYQRGESRSVEDAGAESELRGSTKGGLCEERMYLLLSFLFLFQLVGSADITGPAAVRGPVGGRLTVQCRYGHGWENYRKWWCRGAEWSYCRILVQTDGSEREAKGDRVSIKDSWKLHTFTVTMEKLRWNDTDTYWCGIERTGVDLGVIVKVAIDPAPTTVPTSTAPSNTMSTVPAETEGPTPATSYHSSDSSNSMKLSILIPLTVAVLLLLLVAVSFLALRKMRQQKKAAGVSPEQVVQPPEGEGDLCYANLALQSTSTSHKSSQKKGCTKPSSSAPDDQLEVAYVTMAPLPKEEIPYADLSWELSNQEATYCNMSFHVARVPSRSQEECMEYSSIRRS